METEETPVILKIKTKVWKISTPLAYSFKSSRVLREISFLSTTSHHLIMCLICLNLVIFRVDYGVDWGRGQSSVTYPVDISCSFYLSLRAYTIKCMHALPCVFTSVRGECRLFSPTARQHPPDLELSVWEKLQRVDRNGLKLSTEANNVWSAAVSLVFYPGLSLLLRP